MNARTASPDREKIPKVILRAMFGLVISCLVLVTYARVTDRPLEAMPPDLPIVQERVIHIFGNMDGSAKVLDGNGVLIADYASNEGGFVAGMWRALLRERTKHGLEASAPIRLVQFSDGHLGLRDDLTGWRTELVGFGRDNTASFARLLDL